MQILPLEVKIFMNIQLDVICADMVDFRRLGHILVTLVTYTNYSYMLQSRLHLLHCNKHMVAMIIIGIIYVVNFTLKLLPNAVSEHLYFKIFAPRPPSICMLSHAW